MATSGQNSNKVLMPVGPMTDNFQEKINMCLKWILNDQPPNKPALVQASNELVLLYVGVYPELVESSTDFVSGGLIRNTEPWRRTDKKNQDLYISKESKKAERVLQGFTLLCRGKVEHVTTRVEWANDVHSMVAEVANEIGATHIVVGTDDAKTKSFRINPLKWKSGPTDPGPAHRLTLGSKVAALVHCTVYCISLTSGKLVSELKGEAPYPEDPLPRPGSAASSGMSLENPVDGEPSANPHSPVHHALLASRSLPRPVPHGANGYWPQSPPGSYLVPMPPPGYYNQYPPPYYGPAPGHGGLSPEPSYQYPVTNPGHSGDLFYAPNPYGQPVAVHYSPGPSGSAPEATAHPALVTRSGDSGELRHPPNWPRDYQSVLPSGFIPNQGPSAPPLSSEQYPPPRFGGGIPSARAQPYGPGFDSGYGQTNQATGYEQPQITRRGYFRGPPGGEEYRYNSVDSVPPHRSGLSGQLNGALPSAGEGEPSPGLTGLTGVRDGHLHTAHRASPSDVGRTIGRQQSTENHNGPYEPAGATYERGPVRDLPSYQEFNYAQLAEATNDFSQELGAGGFGTVFLGNFRGTQVAVKRMDPEGLQGPAEFEREAKVLTTLRHRNIVILMGCCPEKFCLVYEYCAQGSLESRLFDDTRPLLWYTRVRIIYEVSLALRWMHELDIIHCDLKLANILLDEHNTAKLGDVGISRVIPSADARTARLTGAQTGTSVQGSHGYVDPALFAGYPQEASSDVYALGVCLLQLLTKRPPGAVRREVTQAYTSQNMLGILDRSAGDWPLAAVVEDLANLAFRCTELYPHDRPNLEDEIIPVLSRLNDLGKAAERRKLDKLHSAEAEADALRAPGARRRDNSDIMETHLFCCPISQEIMEDPVVAADGNTYERSQIETWISVNCTSPVTGLPLANTNLVPNQTLKSAILEWKERNGGQVVDE